MLRKADANARSMGPLGDAYEAAIERVSLKLGSLRNRDSSSSEAEVMSQSLELISILTDMDPNVVLNTDTDGVVKLVLATYREKLRKRRPENDPKGKDKDKGGEEEEEETKILFGSG